MKISPIQLEKLHVRHAALPVLILPALAVVCVAFVSFSPYAALYAQGSGSEQGDARTATTSEDSTASLSAVEADMHEFMEYLFQPNYKQIKQALSSTEQDDAAWNNIKSSALVLAEGGNLLLLRGSETDRSDWTKHATNVRSIGGQLYRAAQSKESAKTQEIYRTLLENCNACHQQFAGGEPQLKP